MLPRTRSEKAGRDRKQHRGENSRSNGAPGIELQVIGRKIEAPAAHAKKDGLSEGQHSTDAVDNREGKREQSPYQDFGREYPLIVGNEQGQNDQSAGQQEIAGAFRCPRTRLVIFFLCSVHRAALANRPCGRSSRTMLISNKEMMRAVVGAAKLVMTPSMTASRTAAAAVPGRLPRPPMMTAMKQRGSTSRPSRNSTEVMGAATTPPSMAMAVPSANVTTKTRFAGTPMAVAISLSWRTARIEVPNLVWCRKRKNPAMARTAMQAAKRR